MCANKTVQKYGEFSKDKNILLQGSPSGNTPSQLGRTFLVSLFRAP